MGQIKNIKLHIVTDIKWVSSMEDEVVEHEHKHSAPQHQPTFTYWESVKEIDQPDGDGDGAGISLLDSWSGENLFPSSTRSLCSSSRHQPTTLEKDCALGEETRHRIPCHDDVSVGNYIDAPLSATVTGIKSGNKEEKDDYIDDCDIDFRSLLMDLPPIPSEGIRKGNCLVSSCE